MAETGPTEAAKFFVSILAAGFRELAAAGEALVREFGPAECGSVTWPFTATKYYRDELGPAPLKTFLAFPGRFPPDELARRKVATNRLEKELAAALGGLPRPVNLDPGYLTQAKLVLASAKNFSHRIYLSDGIYAEITLQYRRGEWKTLPWTFPDYGSGKYDAFFLDVRKKLTEGLIHG